MSPDPTQSSPASKGQRTKETLCRRSALRRMAGAMAVAASSAAAQSQPSPALPTVALGKNRVTRMIAGNNPIGGYAHSVPKLDAVMRNWFTPQRTLEFVERCEAAGINTWQAGPNAKVHIALRRAWDRGSKMQYIALCQDMPDEDWKELVEMKPVAVVHHGEVTDKMFREDRQSKIRDFLKKAHDLGLMAGVSSHSPENIARLEDYGWEQDLYMTCFHNIRRDQDKVKAGLGDVPLGELYLEGDPARMTKVVREVKRPCLGFKILAAGRMCGSRQQIERAFQFAYSNIKPGDAVIVGMFPILTDEITEDAEIARKYAGQA